MKKIAILAAATLVASTTAALADDYEGGFFGGGMSSAFTSGALSGNGSVEALAGNSVLQSIDIEMRDGDRGNKDWGGLTVETLNVSEGVADLTERGAGKGFAAFAGGSLTVWHFDGEFDEDF